MSKQIIDRRETKAVTVRLSAKSRSILDTISEKHGISRTVAIEYIIQLFEDK